MKLLTEWSQWLPNIILIEIAVIVIAGTILLSLLTWKWVKRWWRREPIIDEFQLYRDLPSAEAFLDDWTMTKPPKVDSSPTDSMAEQVRMVPLSALSMQATPESHPDAKCHPDASRDPDSGLRRNDFVRRNDVVRRDDARRNDFIPHTAGEIDGVLETIIQVKRDLRQKDAEISTLSRRLGQQQTINKFAIKEKLLAIRRSELSKRALEQEVRNLELEKEKVYGEMKAEEARNFLEVKERLEQQVQDIELERQKAFVEMKVREVRSVLEIEEKAKIAQKLVMRERVMAEHKSELEMRALEGEIRSLEEERDKAYERVKEKEAQAFIVAKKKAQNIKSIGLKTGYGINFSRLTSAFSKFRFAFDLNRFKRARKSERVEKRFVVDFPKRPPAASVGAPLAVVAPPRDAQDGRKIISVTVPPELMN